MTTTHATQTAPTRTSYAVAIGAVSALLSAGAIAAFAHDAGEIAVMVPGVLVVAGIIFGVVVPRALRKESAGGTALGLSIPAVLLTLPAFWSGLPLVLGVAGMIVGHAGRNARTGGGKCIAALVLGAVAVLGVLTIYGYDLSAGHTGYLFD